MTRALVEAWLAGRAPRRPRELAEEMSRRIARTPDIAIAQLESVADALGAIGAAMLLDVADRDPQAPNLALELLAADAFVTYAFEAAAEEGIEITPIVQGVLAAAQ